MFCKCMTRKEEYQERRKNLCVLSAEAREQRTALVRNAKTEKEALYWGAQPLNRFIVEKYLKRFSGGEFLTFHQTHDIDLMSTIVSELVKSGMGDAWIMKNIGMDADELLRLKQFSGLTELFRNKEFSNSFENL